MPLSRLQKLLGLNENVEDQISMEDPYSVVRPNEIKKESPLDKRKRLMNERYAKISNPNLSTMEKIMPTQEDLEQAQETLGMAMGTIGGVPSAGLGSGLKSLKGVIPSTAGKTVTQAAETAITATERPGLAQLQRFLADQRAARLAKQGLGGIETFGTKVPQNYGKVIRKP